mmetsp:Transcript_28473/g.42085  ORF Transcript_28473/g.42085 Transcript_28473/m.42085 type:complete len:647 (+) Transcript_28473:118-2058(+)|eukprot:CAMPEP_0194225040 /NCGR_PEP_ID=MMETSP0156-20130528/38715_1 /TAXON_ID=33649 /ORGANISM="Thalassionema nitzschioides, Strain L26-B" /LENGTH=646 /DNA_ID=CAMNT_0038956837 /DNA_START=47 /DNA_END=1987 /DNA_ORIENTATION=+
MTRVGISRRRGTRRKSNIKNRLILIGLALLLVGTGMALGIFLVANLLDESPGDATTHAVGVNRLIKSKPMERAVQMLRSRGKRTETLVDSNPAKDDDDGKHLDDDRQNEDSGDDELTANAHASKSIDSNSKQNGSNLYPYSLDPVSSSATFENWKAKGGDRFAEYKDGGTPWLIIDEIQKKSDDQARSRREHVKKAMKFAWDGYSTYAFGHDEVKPQSRGQSSNWGGIGTTLVDSLDTLWLMGLKDEFWKARDWVRDHLTHEQAGRVSNFETTIRSLGGLLSAYDWSKDSAFLDKAHDLAGRLIKAFQDDSPIPDGQVDLKTGRTGNVAWLGGATCTAEAGTLQIENRYLSKVIGDPIFAKKTEHVFEVLSKVTPDNGLFPYSIRNSGDSVKFTNSHLTFGAMSDSFYEYMLKVWLQGGKTEQLYRDMYDKAIQGMHDELVQTSTPSGLTYLADKNGAVMDHKMDHLACFMGGLLVLGAYTDPQGLDSTRAQRDLKTGKALTYTCYQMYARMNTGISPEWIRFHDGRDFEIGPGSPHYLLRPEAVESFFVLSYLTKDPVYREWGWEVFSAIERYCKTDIAYGELSNVENTNQKPRDKMESFFLAETMKYMYLLQDPDSEVDILHKHVFNTEAHPTRIFPVIDQEKE